LPDALLESPRKGFRPFVAAVERDLRDRIVAKRQPVGCALETRELDILVDADAEQAGELPVEMMLRKSGDGAQRLDASVPSRK
jgi:hypothetical protein